MGLLFYSRDVSRAISKFLPSQLMITLYAIYTDPHHHHDQPHLLFIYSFTYIPWIIRGKTNLDIGIVNGGMDATKQCTCNISTNMV